MNETRKSRLTSGVFSSTTDLWATPQAFFDELDREFHFTLDPCANDENHKCDKYYTIEQDGLRQDWGGQKCSAIRPTAEPSAHGSRNATRNRRSPTRWWSCSSLQGQTRRTFTITSTTKPSCASSVDGCISTRHRRALRFRAWW